MQSPVLEFDKNCTLNAYFLQKVDFCIFEPKDSEVVENSSKTLLALVHYTAHNWAKIISISLGLSKKKKEIESGNLELPFSVYNVFMFSRIPYPTKIEQVAALFMYLLFHETNPMLFVTE